MLVVSGAVQNFTYDNFTVLSVAPAAGQVGGGTVVVLRLSLVSMETAYYCSFRQHLAARACHVRQRQLPAVHHSRVRHRGAGRRLGGGAALRH